MTRKAKFDPLRLAAIVAANLDEYAQRYLDAMERVEELKEQLLYVCRKGGFTPKDAPKTKMLAGELYEVLASRATRTDVDQKRAARAEEFFRLHGPATLFSKLFQKRTVYELKDNWQRETSNVWPIKQARIRRLLTSCLLTKKSQRLTVRKKKSVGAQHAAPAKRKAA